jgi:hypothetical protein
MRLLDFRLTLLNVTLFLRLLSSYPRRFYLLDLALTTPLGSAEIVSYLQGQTLVFALHFLKWSRLWTPPNPITKLIARASANTARP